MRYVASGAAFVHSLTLVATFRRYLRDTVAALGSELTVNPEHPIRPVFLHLAQVALLALRHAEGGFVVAIGGVGDVARLDVKRGVAVEPPRERKIDLGQLAPVP